MARRSIWPVNAVAVLVGFCMYATGYLVPQFVQSDPAADGFGFGAGVTETGLFLLPALGAGLLSGAAAGALGGRTGSKLPLRLGIATMAGGYAVLAVAHAVAWPVYLGTLLAHGIGLNLAYTAMSNLIVAAAPAAQVGESSGHEHDAADGRRGAGGAAGRRARLGNIERGLVHDVVRGVGHRRPSRLGPLASGCGRAAQLNTVYA